MSGFEEGGILLIGDIQLSIDVRDESIVFTNLNDGSQPTFTVSKSMPEFIKYMKDSIRATATSTGRTPPQEIIDLHENIKSAEKAELKSRHLGTEALLQLCKYMPENKIDETISQVVSSVLDMDNAKNLTISGITITEEGEKKLEKKLVFKDENNNELLNISKKTFKELRQDLRLGLEELRLSGIATRDQIDALNRLNQKQDESANAVFNKVKEELITFGKIDSTNPKAQTEGKIVLASVCPRTEYDLNEKSTSKNYSELPRWAELQSVFDEKKAFNDQLISSQLNFEEQILYRSGRHREVMTVKGLVPNQELAVLKSSTYVYDRTGFNSVADGKLAVYANPNKMEAYWLKAQLLVKTGRVNDIKFYFNDPDSEIGEKGRVCILFYVDNFHDRGELDRVRELMIQNNFIKCDDKTPVFKTGVPNTVACRYPDLTIADEHKELFGEIIRRPVVSNLQDYA